MAFADVAGIRVCRTGYTGEHGYELLVPADEAGAVWDALLAAAAPLDGRPCGLAARDTLRTEMGYPLHGQDLSGGHHPGAGGQRVGGGLEEAGVLGPRGAGGREGGRARRGGCAGCGRPGRGVPRPGMAVLDAAGEPVGVTTSGTFSPTLKAGHRAGADRHGVAASTSDDPVSVDVRGRALACTVVEAAVRAVARALTRRRPINSDVRRFRVA